MPLNTQFRVKNDLNTLGRILSGGTDILSIFSPSNTSYTVAGTTGSNFTVAGGQTLTLSGSNIVVNTGIGTRTAGFSIAALGVGTAELSGNIPDSKLATISTAGKVANSATTATDANTSSAIVARDASGNFSANVINGVTGFRVNGAATSGNVLRGNGTNFVTSTLAASDIVSGTALSAVNDTNVLLTVGGAASVALLSAASITAGWTGQLASGRGGTGNAFTRFSGPTTSEKTFTLPDASATILTTNTAVTIGQGGTGQTTQQTAINALAGAVTNQQYLRGNGTNVVMSAIQAGDVPTLNQNTTGSAGSVANSVTFNNSGAGATSPTSFNGSTAQTISHNTIGASPLAGSTSLTTVGTIGSGTWNGNTIGISFGGTGATTQQAAINALVGGAGTGGRYLRSDGTNVALTAIQAGDVPILNQNTTGSAGSAATLTTSRTIAISGDLSYTSPAFNGSANVIGTGTLATVNSNVGSFTNASVTVNGKGLVTAVSSGTAPVTTVTGTSPISSSGGTTPAISLATGYGDTQNPYGSKTQNTFLAAPNGSSGAPTFRAIVSTDVPTLNQNTTGQAGSVANAITFNTSGGAAAGTTYNGTAIRTIDFSTVGASPLLGSTSLVTTGTVTTGTWGAALAATSGTINNTSIGATTPSTGRFTTLESSGNLTVGGNLTVVGSATYISTNNLIVEDPIIFLGEGNTSDTVDIGFTAAYNHSSPLSARHTGLIRDFGDKKWTLFSGLTSEVLSSVNINFNDPSIVIDTLKANIEGNVTGNASTATTLQTARNFSLGTGDVTSPAISFNGSGAVSFVTTIQTDAVTTTKILNNNVTYAKFQQVAANSVVGNPTGSTANAQAIPTSATGLALLSATNAAAGATTLGLGANNSVTHNDLTLGGSSPKVNNAVYVGGHATDSLITIPTFNKTTYSTGRYTVQIKHNTSNARAVLDILVTNNANSWDGTVFGIVDPSNIFSNVNVTTLSTTVDLAFTLNANNTNHSITILSTAIAD